MLRSISFFFKYVVQCKSPWALPPLASGPEGSHRIVCHHFPVISCKVRVLRRALEGTECISASRALQAVCFKQSVMTADTFSFVPAFLSSSEQLQFMSPEDLAAKRSFAPFSNTESHRIPNKFFFYLVNHEYSQIFTWTQSLLLFIKHVHTSRPTSSMFSSVWSPLCARSLFCLQFKDKPGPSNSSRVKLSKYFEAVASSVASLNLHFPAPG